LAQNPRLFFKLAPPLAHNTVMFRNTLIANFYNCVADDWLSDLRLG